MGLNYTVLSEDEKTCEVGSNVDASGDVVIPSTVMNGDNEYRVTAIGTDAFYLNIPMTSISIPESVTVIRSQALSRCLGLTEVVIPNSVTEMGSRAMYACNYLERLTISSGLREIQRETFSGCPWLEEIVIPDGVEIIHDEAFNYCARVTSLTIGSTVRSIGVMSFAGLGALTSVSIPASVETVGREAFSYCNKLAEVTIEEGGSPLSFDTDVFGQTQYLGTYDDPVAKNRHPQYQPALHLHILRRQTDAFRLQAYAYHHQYRHHSPGTSRIGLRRLRGGGNCKLRHDRMSRSILIHIQQCRLLQCHSRRTALLRRKIPFKDSVE